MARFIAWSRPMARERTRGGRHCPPSFLTGVFISFASFYFVYAHNVNMCGWRRNSKIDTETTRRHVDVERNFSSVTNLSFVRPYHSNYLNFTLNSFQQSNFASQISSDGFSLRRDVLGRTLFLSRYVRMYFKTGIDDNPRVGT